MPHGSWPVPVGVRRAMAVLLAALVGVACGGRDDDGDFVDLTDLLPLADVLIEPGPIDFGTPAAHPYLLDGWSADEAGPAPWTSFVWGTGDRSSLQFHLAFQRDLRVWFRGFPAVGAAGQLQQVEVRVNGQTVATVELEGGTFAEYEVDVPRQATAVGTNRIEFGYAFSMREAVPPFRDLAVAWDALRVTAGDPQPPSRMWLDGSPWLLLPPRSQVDYYVPAGEAFTIALDQVALYRPDGDFDDPAGQVADLQVVISDEAGSVERIFTPAGPEPVAWTPRLNVASSDTVRVTLRGVEAFDPAPTLAVRRPRVSHPRPAPAPSPCAAVPVPRPSNVLVYLVDTLRRDHLGVYGYGRDVSPRLDAFARTAVVFEHAIAQAPWTRPSVASLFTGQLPPRHGVETPLDRLDAGAVTLARLFREAGYDTAAFATNANVSPETGLDQGFDHFQEFPEILGSPEVHVLSDVVGRAVAQYLDGRESGRPWFLYVHTADPHTPYAPRSPWRDRFASGSIARLSIGEVQALGSEGATPERRQAAVDLYDAEVAFNDDEFGRLLDDLQSRGVMDETLVIFLSDHGEAFGEHGEWEHGSSLYNEQIDIPLVIRFPGGLWGGTRVADLTSHVDLLPTLSEWIGAVPPADTAGRSLLGPTACPDATDAAVGSSWLRLLDQDVVAVVTEEAKLIRYRASATRRKHGFELFERPADPAERVDNADAFPLTRGRLAAVMRALERTPRTDERGAPLSRGLEDRLRALGYIR